jgi:hypothetical protein
LTRGAGRHDVVVELAPDLDPGRIPPSTSTTADRLRNAVLDALITSGKGRTLGADRIVVTVTRFRLRSTAAGVAVGGITARVVTPTADGRFNGLVIEAAQRLVTML